MKIAVLSGKGGTGKTLVAVNLAAVAKYSKYMDCDVEEPNGHLFFKPTQVESEKIWIKLPVVQEELCNGCKKCIGSENPSEEFCKDKKIKTLGSIPYDNELGTLNSNAFIAARESEKYNKMFFSIYKNVLEEVQNETTLNS